ncbi:hypothetical protein BC826DRAFT_974315 [Russula brevipes]|nr:hypothetical protein BC826DRAFT_974315 [Russula brevipes]
MLYKPLISLVMAFAAASSVAAAVTPNGSGGDGRTNNNANPAVKSLLRLTYEVLTCRIAPAPRPSTQFAAPQLRTAVSPLGVRRSPGTEEHSTLRAARVELAVVRMESSRNLNEVEGVVGHFSVNDPYIFGTDGYYCGDERRNYFATRLLGLR